MTKRGSYVTTTAPSEPAAPKSPAPATPGPSVHAGVPLRDRGSSFTDEITMDFADACATASTAGLKFVDIRRVWGVFSHDVPRERWSEMANILKDNGLRIGAIQSNFGKCAISGPEYEAHMKFFPILVEQAQYFGTDTMRVFPFWNELPVRHDPPYPGGIRPNLKETLSEIVSQFKPAADLAAREGIKLGFEPEHSTYSGAPQEVACIVEAINNPYVGVAWDVNNGWDDCSVDDAYALFKGKIWNVHVKERTLTPDEHQAVRGVLGGAPRETSGTERSSGSSDVRGAVTAPADAATRLRRQPTLLGTGALPWQHVVTTLEKDGYRGLYSIETHFGVRGEYGWPKLKAATTYFMYGLREILATAEARLAG